MLIDCNNIKKNRVHFLFIIKHKLFRNTKNLHITFYNYFTGNSLKKILPQKKNVFFVSVAVQNNLKRIT